MLKALCLAGKSNEDKELKYQILHLEYHLQAGENLFTAKGL